MGLWSPNLLAVAKRTGGKLIPTLELDLRQTAGAAVTRFKYTGQGYRGFYGGTHSPTVKQWGSIRRGVGLKESSLETFETSVILVDADEFFRTLTRGSGRRGFKRSPARIQITSPELYSQDWFTAFYGIIHRWKIEKKVVTLTLRPDYSALRRAFPTRTISEQDYPYADAGALGQYVQIVYGIHDSKGITDTGFLPLYLVDKQAFIYGGIAGRIKIRRLFVDGVAATDYTHTTVTRNGFAYTEVKFAVDKGKAAVTIDAEGYDEIGDGNGELITNPARIMEHILANWLFEPYTYGNWAGQPGSLRPYPTQLDAASWVAMATFFSDLGIKGSRYYPAEQRTGMDALNEWADSFFVKPFLTNTGQIAVRALDHRKIRPVTDTNWLRTEDITLSEGTDTDALVRSFSVQYLYDSVARKYNRTLELIDLTVAEDEGTVNIQHPWSPAEA